MKSTRKNGSTEPRTAGWVHFRTLFRGTMGFVEAERVGSPIAVAYKSPPILDDRVDAPISRSQRLEAGMLPTELLPLNYHFKYSKINRLRAKPKLASLRTTTAHSSTHDKRRNANNPGKMVQKETPPGIDDSVAKVRDLAAWSRTRRSSLSP